MKTIDFDDKLKNLNTKITSNKTKHVVVKNQLNEVSKKVEAISTKELTKDLKNRYSVINVAIYFYSGILQTYFLFIPAKKYIK